MLSVINDLLKESGLTIRDFDVIELNEAFAAQGLACQWEIEMAIFINFTYFNKYLQ